MSAAADALAALLPPDALAAEGYESPALGRPPEAVARPSTTEEVARLLEWATREGVGVLPVASGRRVEPVAREGRYVALATDRLVGIEQYEAANLTLTAGAGTSFATVAGALAENAQWAPFDPPHVSERSLGGLVATGESGPLRMGYGDLRHHVLGLTVVAGDGRVLDLGGRVVKNVAGFDVLKAVVGSRGTLGVVASVCLRAFPRPDVDRVLLHSGTSVADLLRAALDVGTAPILPVSCVVVDALPATGDGPALVVRLQGARETVDADQRRLEEHVGFRFRTADAREGGSSRPDGGVELGQTPRGDPAAGPDAGGWSATDVLTAARDHASDHDVVVHASALPSRLHEVASALDAIEADALAIDSYSGFVRAGTSVDRLAAGSEVRAAIEGLGGGMRISVRGGDPEAVAPARALGTNPSDGEAALVGRLREIFDPEEVLWPTRP